VPFVVRGETKFKQFLHFVKKKKVWEFSYYSYYCFGRGALVVVVVDVKKNNFGNFFLILLKRSVLFQRVPSAIRVFRYSGR